jgi:hypothetical protein
MLLDSLWVVGIAEGVLAMCDHLGKDVAVTLLLAAMTVGTAGCREIIVNSVCWTTALVLEESNIVKPLPGQRPARAYILGYRVKRVAVRAEPPLIDSHTRELFEFADGDENIYAIDDSDGGVARAYVPRRRGGEVRFESFSPDKTRRPIPERSRKILLQIIRR